MTQAHIGSITPVKNRVLSVDEHCAALFHYDLNEHDVLRGVKAIGSEKVHNFNTSNYIDFGSPSQLQVDGDLTIEMWLKPSDFAARRNPIAKAYGGEYTITQETSSGSLSFYYGSSGGNGGSYHGYGSPSITLNQWNHCVIVRNMTTMQMIWYINGVAHTPYTITIIPKAGTNPVYIGQGYVSRYNGGIRDVRIWAKAKTQQQIIDEMYEIKDESGLRARWLLTEGEGDIIRDESPFHHDGIITGGSQWTAGDSVFTLRRREGKFGGGIAIEEGTTNLIPSPDFSNYSQSTYVTEVSTYEDTVKGAPAKILKMQYTGSGDGNVIVNMDVADHAPSTTYTFSFYVKADGDAGLFAHTMIQYYTTSWKQIGWSTTSLPREWTKITVTGTTTADAATSFRVVFRPPDVAGVNIYYTMPQIEQKPYATSFVNGSRGMTHLKYPNKLSNGGTISLWVKSLNKVSADYIIEYREADVNNTFCMYRDSGNDKVRYWIKDSAGAMQAYTGTAIVFDGNWHHFVLTIKDNDNGMKTFKGYVDGVLDSEGTYDFGNISTNAFYLGVRHSAGYPLNGIIDELRIDTVARTDEEILAWYESNSPFWPRGIYRKSY